MSLVSELRAATRDLHEQIERLPFAQALVSGQMQRAPYVAALAQLYAIHRTLESELERQTLPSAVYHPGMNRSSSLARDLVALQAGPCTLPLFATQTLTAHIRAWSVQSPPSLLGALYILEGSRMGSLVVVKPLAAGLRVPLAPGHGLDYHLQDLADRPRAWQQFKAALETLPLSAEEQAGIVQAGVITMQRLHDMYAALPVSDTVCLMACAS